MPVFNPPPRERNARGVTEKILSVISTTVLQFDRGIPFVHGIQNGVLGQAIHSLSFTSMRTLSQLRVRRARASASRKVSFVPAKGEDSADHGNEGSTNGS